MKNNKQIARIMILNGIIFGLLSLTILGLLAVVQWVMVESAGIIIT